MPCWAGGNINLPSDSNILKTVKISIYLATIFSKKNSASFLMVFSLIDFALAVLKLLMFEVCVIIGISKIEIFNFPGAERVKKN